MNRNKLFDDTGFNIGFWLGVLLCVVSNYISYFIASVEYKKIKFGPKSTMPWGFAFDGFGGDFGGMNTIANFFIFAFVCFGLGLSFRFVWSKIKD